MPLEMRPLEKMLRQFGFDVESPLLAGHGGTHIDLLNTRWTDWVESARQSLRGLLERNDQVVVCGLSMGATIGSILALEEKRVVGCVLLSSTLMYDAITQQDPRYRRCHGTISHNLTRLASTYIPFLGKTLYWEESPPYGLKDKRLQKQITKQIEAAKSGESNEFGLFRTYFGSLSQMSFMSDWLMERANKIQCPALLIHSLEDTIASIDNATRLYERFNSQYKCLKMIEGCDHVMPLDLKRKQVASLLCNFVNNIHNGFHPVATAEQVKVANKCDEGFVITIQPSTAKANNLLSCLPVNMQAGAEAEAADNKIHKIEARRNGELVVTIPVMLGNMSVLLPQPNLFPFKNKLQVRAFIPLAIEANWSKLAEEISLPETAFDNSLSWLVKALESLANAYKVNFSAAGLDLLKVTQGLNLSSSMVARQVVNFLLAKLRIPFSGNKEPFIHSNPIVQMLLCRTSNNNRVLQTAGEIQEA